MGRRWHGSSNATCPTGALTDWLIKTSFNPLPPRAPTTDSRFRKLLNRVVEYVGSRACIECHRDQYQSYLQTTHSRSLGNVDVSREPPDGEVFHEPSGRHYRIYREGETLRLREFIQDTEGQEVVLVDCAARFALGSGNYARMYLVKVDDFLIEAPVTWYPRRKVWVYRKMGKSKDAESQLQLAKLLKLKVPQPE